MVMDLEMSLVIFQLRKIDTRRISGAVDYLRPFAESMTIGLRELQALLRYTTQTLQSVPTLLFQPYEPQVADDFDDPLFDMDELVEYICSLEDQFWNVLRLLGEAYNNPSIPSELKRESKHALLTWEPTFEDASKEVDGMLDSVNGIYRELNEYIIRAHPNYRPSSDLGPSMVQPPPVVSSMWAFAPSALGAAPAPSQWYAANATRGG
jgi:hypothetical protein